MSHADGAILALLDKFDAAIADAIKLRDERSILIKQFHETGVRDPDGAFGRLTMQLQHASERILAIRAALQALGAPSLPLDSDFHNKSFSAATLVRVLGRTHGLSKQELDELNDRVSALRAERQREQQQRKAGAP